MVAYPGATRSCVVKNYARFVFLLTLAFGFLCATTYPYLFLANHAKLTPQAAIFEKPGLISWNNFHCSPKTQQVVIRLGAKYPGQQVGLTELEPELDAQSEVDDQTLRHLSGGDFRLDEILSSWEQRYINAALKLSSGNLSEAARLLGVNRTTLYSKIQRLSDGDE